MESADAIIEELNSILIRQFEVVPESIRPEARLRDDLDLDSLDAADLLIAIEKRFRVRLDDQEVRKLTTVGEVHAYVRAVVSGATPAPGAAIPGGEGAESGADHPPAASG